MERTSSSRGGLPDEVVDWLYALPPQAELDGVLYVHGSPLSDVESFAPEPRGRRGAAARRRARPARSSSATATSSSGGPGRTARELSTRAASGCRSTATRRAAWAVRTDDGEFEFRRTEYDIERAADAYRELGGEFGEFAARRIERGSD